MKMELGFGLYQVQSFNSSSRTNRTVIDGDTYATEADGTLLLRLFPAEVAYFPGEGMLLDDDFKIPPRTSKAKAQEMIRKRVAELKASGAIRE